MDFAFVTLLLVTDLKFSRKYLVVSIIICTFAPYRTKAINEETIITDHHHLSEHRGIRRPGRLGTSQTERDPLHN